MAISRYRNVNRINIGGQPRYFATSEFPTKQELDEIAVIKIRVSKFDRLDQLASKHLGDGKYWWIIALMNNIDWAYDIEDGQILKIPVNVEDVLRLM